MGQKSVPVKAPAEQVVKEIRRATRRQFSAEEKIRIVPDCAARTASPSCGTIGRVRSNGYSLMVGRWGHRSRTMLHAASSAEFDRRA